MSARMKCSTPLLPALLASLILAASTCGASSPVTVDIEAQSPGKAIPADYTGLSFEVSLLLPDANGRHYFRPDNQPLIRLFHTLGIKNLRIGGNTSDRDVRRLPLNSDFDSLFEFAKAAGVKVVYCLRLHNGTPAVDAATVKHIMDRYPAQVDSFSIGQEPSAYPVEKVDTRAAAERMGATNEKYSYAEYSREWKKFQQVIVAAVPNVRFCGPSVHNNGTWAERFMNDFGRGYHVTLITEHLYPGGAGGKVPTPQIGIERMLGDDFVKAYNKLHDSFVPLAISNGLPYRLEEVNNYFNGGATNVSNTFASALWGLDFLYWWAAHDAAGVNFHTGDRVAAGSSLQPSKYTAFFSTTNGYLIRPLGYGITAFNVGSHGKLLPLKLGNRDNVNLSAYAVSGADGKSYVTLINKEHGEHARSAQVRLSSGRGSNTASPTLAGEALHLTAASVTATNGVMLNGIQIKNDGSWAETWSPINASAPSTIEVPAASAVVLKLMSF
jgi:hypothetical protein